MLQWGNVLLAVFNVKENHLCNVTLSVERDLKITEKGKTTENGAYVSFTSEVLTMGTSKMLLKAS